MLVFLLLGVIWAAVLVPPWVQARREGRPNSSIVMFHRQLWLLERTTPSYAAGTLGSVGGASTPAGVAGSISPRGMANGPGGPGPSVAAHERRTAGQRRRRQLLGGLTLAVVATLPVAALGGLPPLWVAQWVIDGMLLGYLLLLVRRGHRRAERVRKVRYLSPIREPRPAVVVLEGGAAR